MAGFEVVVRPVVFPDIRPAPARSLPPEDDPEKGFATIGGNGAKQVDLSFSHSVSMSKSRSTETERREDEARVYQEEDDGTINEENFVDIGVANRIKSKEPSGPTGDFVGFNGDDAVATVPGRGFTGDDIVKTAFYEPVKEKANVKVRRRDVIKKAGEEK